MACFFSPLLGSGYSGPLLPAVARSERALSMPACPPAKVMELTCRLPVVSRGLSLRAYWRCTVGVHCDLCTATCALRPVHCDLCTATCQRAHWLSHSRGLSVSPEYVGRTGFIEIMVARFALRLLGFACARIPQCQAIAHIPRPEHTFASVPLDRCVEQHALGGRKLDPHAQVATSTRTWQRGRP